MYFENSKFQQPDDADVAKELDRRLVELQSLFETSRVLNSSLNLHTILNNMLLTLMGRMMISKGMVMLASDDSGFKIEIIKGMPRNLLNKIMNFDIDITEPTFIKETNPDEHIWADFFKEFAIELILPIESNNKTLGVVGFGPKISRIPYSVNELEFLNSLSNIAATSIENGLIFRELENVNRQLDKKIQELNTLFDYGKELNSTLDVDKILNLLTYAVMGELVVGRCMVFLKDDSHMQLKIYKGMKLDPDSADETFQRCLHELGHVQIPFIVEEIELPDKLFFLTKNDIKIVAPMKIQDETKGILAIGEKISRQKFRKDELEFLYTLGNQAIISLENARLFQETLEKQRMEEELNIAREIQQGLLPKVCPEPAGFQIHGINIPSLHVGGDYFDCIKFDDHHFGICIADVSGKGAPASLLMSNLQAGLHALCSAQCDIAEMTSKINNLIYKNTGMDKFITFFYGLLNCIDRSFTYVNAGHNPPLLCNVAGVIELLPVGGLLLGMMPHMSYDTEKIMLKPGDVILLFTDGINEAMNAEEEDFGDLRIQNILKHHILSSSKTIVDTITKEVRKFAGKSPQSDDITLVCIKMNKD